MALDGILLSKILPEIQASLPARIQKIHQISRTEVLFQIHGPNKKEQLLISCHSQYNRILLTKRSYPTPDEPGNFVMLLRKYLDGAIIESVTQENMDRWCVFSIERRNEIGDPEPVHLYIELMGKYANLILVNQAGIIIDAMKRIPPFENNTRTIHPGARFTEVPPQKKKNPFEQGVIEPDKTLTEQFSGFSPLLSREIEYRMSSGASFRSVMEEIRNSDLLYLCDQKDDTVFHCIELKHIGPCRTYPVFEGLDVLYYHKEEKERIREISGDLFHIVKRELKHQKTKLPRLLKEFDSAKNCGIYRIYGDLLYAHQIRDTKGKTAITLLDYESGKEISVPLDPKLDGFRNAQKCYTKYGKLKKGQGYLKEQIEVCEKEIAYFEGLLIQLDQADFATAAEIKEELIKGGYIRKAPKKNNRKKCPSVPQIKTVTAPSGIAVSFGKNNLQNDYLSFKLAKKNEIWLHAKDYHGAHVLIHHSAPDEETLRFAANLAAYYSGGRNSSSVPVNWCPVSQIKKIPGAKPGMVQLGSYRTIYIDPEETELKAVL